MEIAKEYLPKEVEKRWLERWEESGLFRAAPDSGKEPFCMVIPPPNVTGNLHLGHVLVFTLHDIVARWRRMQGYDVLWLPGTDHAGIATQTVVERELGKENLTRHDLGREAFERRVWEWKETYGNKILDSLHKLGASCDWSRERFTLDEGLSRAVRAVFVRLYEEGLIYRGRYIVNWCIRCHTAISDLETVHEPVAGKLYTIRYPFPGGVEGVEVATTRPETMFGDVAVAVHPDDARYTAIVGREVVLPMAERSIPVIADPFVERDFGTGVVKITPAHDPNDFAAGKRHGLPEVLALDTSGIMTKAAGEFEGLERFEAREAVVKSLEESGLLLAVKDHEHAVGHCQRCRSMIEPMVSTQWFVKIEDLAQPAIEAVEDGRTEFIPATWAKTYYEWMRNIHDWCISRQLWWGHRIPAWYCDDCDTVVVSETDPQGNCENCGKALRQDDDVLDTWFSSALWPFSTMGWPRQTPDLERYYPTQLLITGFDIIFFWVARMIMMGLKFGKDVPFDQVYIHGLVRDAQGQKMSKSKGNTIDPIEVQDRYGTDAVRFTMSIMAAPGNDIPLAPERMDGYRAFANKLWNACRFVLMRLGDEPAGGKNDGNNLTLVDRWILSEAHKLIGEVSASMEEFRFDRASDALYHFVWHQFCDWYIEFVKPELLADDGSADSGRIAATRSVLLEVLDILLHMLHPFMPFITEELWAKLPGRDGLLAGGKWPDSRKEMIDTEAVEDVETLKSLVAGIRNLRAENRIDPGKRIRVQIKAGDGESAALLADQSPRVASLVRASEIVLVDNFEDGIVAARAVIGNFEAAIPLEGLLDLDTESARLRKELSKIEKELMSRKRKLENHSFLERAPAEVVEKERSIYEELRDKMQRVERTLETISGESQT